MSKINSTRGRAPNFTREEQELLCKTLEAYMHIIECKKTDSVKQSHKQDAWSKVAELYNANTKHVPRTVENLISCYRNMKSKIKKDHSEAKMNLQDSNQKEMLINALAENGRNWPSVSQQVNKPIEQCQNEYEQLKVEFKKEELLYKKKVLGTGGGPPPSDDEDSALEKLRKIIEPQVDGMYTIYDGDSQLMAEFQQSLPLQERQNPLEEEVLIVIEEKNETEERNTMPEDITVTPLRLPVSRQDMLKKKRDLALSFSKIKDKHMGTTSKKTCNDTYQALAEAKMELVQLQKKVLEMDVEHKKKTQELELQDLISQNKYKEEVRQKELLLLDLKIKKLSE